jgi:hypothetical protein
MHSLYNEIGYRAVKQWSWDLIPSNAELVQLYHLISLVFIALKF